MNTRTAWIVYSLLRLAFFAVPFAVVMILLTMRGFSQVLAAIISAVVAALVAVSLSVIFLAKPREAASTSIYEWRNRKRTADDEVEDAAVENAPQQDGAIAVEPTTPQHEAIPATDPDSESGASAR